MRARAPTRSGRELARLLQDSNAEMFDETGKRRKLIVFTEHRDTLNYLADRIRTLLGQPEAVVDDPRRYAPRGAPRGAGGVSRRTPTSRSSSRPTPPARASTSSAPTCSSTTTCPGTRTGSSSASAASTASARPRSATCGTSSPPRRARGRSSSACSTKLAEQSQGARRPGLRRPRRRHLRGHVAARPPDRGRPLRRAARGQGELDQIVDAAVGEKLEEALKERALLTEMMSATDVEEIRERDGGGRGAQAPAALHPRLLPRGVPAARRPDREARAGPLRDHARPRRDPRARQGARRGRPGRRPLRARHLREGARLARQGRRRRELLAPGHPAARRDGRPVLERYRPLLKQGAVLVADADESEEPRALVYVEHAIQNAQEIRDGQRQVVSQAARSSSS